LGRCDSSHGGDGKSEDVELHFDGGEFVLETVGVIELVLKEMDSFFGCSASECESLWEKSVS
jgi:hypothetical protein